jgi:hypothetical protein
MALVWIEVGPPAAQRPATTLIAQDARGNRCR